MQNRLQDADYNYYNEGTVTYLSRSDWQGTFPKSYGSLSIAGDMADRLDNRVYTYQTGSSDIEFGVDHTLEYDEDGNQLENMSVAEMKLASFDDERWDYLLTQITVDEAWYFAPDGGSRCRAFVSVNAPEVWQIGRSQRRHQPHARPARPFRRHDGNTEERPQLRLLYQ